jgi:uracil-DNA glycosylase
MKTGKIISLIGEDWFNLIGKEFYKDYLLDIGMKVAIERKSYKIYPESPEDTFSVFRNLSPSNIKVVIIGQDPYVRGEYDGKAFSNSEDLGKVSPSLKNILKEVEDDVYDGLNLNGSSDLTRWEQQGVFLMNRSLTVREGASNSHLYIKWHEFTNMVISKLSETYPEIVFMLWGANARSVNKYISTNRHLILETGHPSPLSANKGYWFGNKHFSKANSFLKEVGKTTIIW